MTQSPLDAAVMPAVADLERRGFPAPSVLLLMGTGVGMLPAALRSATKIPLGKLTGVPPAWSDVVLHAGALGGTNVWMLDDAAGPPEQGALALPGEPPWVRGFPCWLAAAAGAAVCVHTSAGHALPAEARDAVAVGSLVIASDHINLSGRTPLVGLGESKLGPLFPDQTRLHHADLRERALRYGSKLGVPVVEAVVACVVGPSLDTPAERRFFGRAGAGVAVQNLEGPLLACAHAGLSVLALVAVTDGGEGIENMPAIVARADKLAPAIEALLESLAPDLERAARELGVEA